MNRYTAYDMNADGRAEINSLKALFPNPEPYSPAPNGVAIVLVDPKIVTDDPAIQMSRFEMSLWLGQLGSDMSRDGFFPYFVEANVYDGPVHQDGLTVLALRRFLRDVRANYPLAGVLLVGSFPDAAIVRSVFLKPHADKPVPLNSGAAHVSAVGDFLAVSAEFITPRAEIVLGDLDGNWEPLYVQAPFTVTNYDLLPQLASSDYPNNGQIIETPSYQITDVETYRDVFYIQDHQVSASTDSGWLRLAITSVDEPNPELSAADRLRPNRIARPEILVSRIDPKRVAVMPTVPYPDLDGKLPLDASGKPQKLRYSAPVDITWRRDASLERRLIADYIARSHRFRLGYDGSLTFRTSAIRSDDDGLMSPTGFNGLLRRASDLFTSSLATDHATLLDYITWLKQPAVLRGIAAHSNQVNSQFAAITNPWILELATGGLDPAGNSHVWRWVRKGGPVVGQASLGPVPDYVLEPSFEGITVDANFHIHRTMFETGALASSGQVFYVHDGCNVMRPMNAETVPYNDPTYGQVNYRGGVANGESLMFYTNGLGLMARNKVFNDTPAGYYEEIKKSGRFGYGWRAYFVSDSGNTSLDERGANFLSDGADRQTRTLQRKRSYLWNTIGDFTLKIRY